MMHFYDMQSLGDSIDFQPFASEQFHRGASVFCIIHAKCSRVTSYVFYIHARVTKWRIKWRIAYRAMSLLGHVLLSLFLSSFR